MTWLKEKQELLRRDLQQYGIQSHDSEEAICNFLLMKGLIGHFFKIENHEIDYKRIKKLKHLHPVLDMIVNLQKVEELLSNSIFDDAFVCIDKRLHPQHLQLGADTGRQTSKLPNILGLNHLLRPIIVPSSGYGICEVDLSQQEVGIAAAIYKDSCLLEMYNTGDVYTAMAKRFFKDTLPAEAILLSDSDFREQFGDERSKMKECTLGMLYGLSHLSLAEKLNISKYKAKNIHNRFLNMFPELQRSATFQKSIAAIRGYSCTINGLRRYRAHRKEPTSWELNWFINFPIQGSAAITFKAAGNKLYSTFKDYDAHLLIPLHDSFVFEAPVAVLEEVAIKAKNIMCQAIKDYFPALNPIAQINIKSHWCWNKDGRDDLFEEWFSKI